MASIIITCAFFMLTQFTTFFEITSRAQEDNSKLIKFYNNLQQDLHGSKLVVKNGNEIVCQFNNHKIIYQIDGDVLIRDFLEVKDSLITNELEVKAGYVTTNKSNGILKDLYLNFNALEQDFSWGLHKTYGASVYINNQEQQ